jgi:hypothetical protein
MRIEQVGQLGGASRLLALGDKYLYLQVGPRLAVVDISDPTLPYIVGQSEILDGITSIRMSFGDVLVGGTTGTAYRFQIDPAGQPVLARTYQPGDSDFPKIESLPENQISTPDYTIEYDLAWQEYSSGQPLKIHKSGYEVIEAFAGLPEGQLARGNNITARGRYVYIAIGDEMEIYDLALPPERPLVWGENDPDQYRKTLWQKVGSLRPDVGTLSYGGGMYFWMGEICAAGKYLDGNGVWSLDDPENPQKTASPPSLLYPCYTVEVKGGAIRRSMSDGFYTYMVPNGDGTYTGYNVDTGLDAYYALGAGNDILVLQGPSKEDDYYSYSIYLVDIADPFQPRLLSTYSYIEGGPYFEDGYRFVGQYLYIFANPDIVLDISDPTNPRIASPSAPYFNFEEDTIVQGEWIYNLRGDLLDVLSTSDPRTTVATLDLPEPAGVAHFPAIHSMGSSLAPYLWHTEDRLFVYAHFPDAARAVLFVIDISDPLNPFILASAQMEVYQVVSYGDYLYVHQFEKGIGIYKLVPN